MRQIAICGTATSSREMVNDLPSEVERWGLNNGYKFLRQRDRWFEMHNPSNSRRLSHDKDYREWLGALEIDLYMIEATEEFPKSIAYPLKAVTEAFDSAYLTSTMSYMVALALYEHQQAVRAEEETKPLEDSLSQRVSMIYVFGVNMTVGTEFAHQKASFEFWLGMANGMGVNVALPPNCPLLSGDLYGRERPERLPREMLIDRLRDLAEQEVGLQRERHILLGAVEATERTLEEGPSRGDQRKKTEAQLKDMKEKQQVNETKFHVLSGATQVAEGFLQRVSLPPGQEEYISTLQRYPVVGMVETPQ